MLTYSGWPGQSENIGCTIFQYFEGGIALSQSQIPSRKKIMNQIIILGTHCFCKLLLLLLLLLLCIEWKYCNLQNDVYLNKLFALHNTVRSGAPEHARGLYNSNLRPLQTIKVTKNCFQLET